MTKHAPYSPAPVKQMGGEGMLGLPKGVTDAVSDVTKSLSDLMPKAGGEAQIGGRRRRGAKRSGSKRSGSKRRGSKRSGSKRSGSKRHSHRRSKKGGNGVIATAAVPFGLLALQRYFKGSRTSKKGVRKMGNTFKRTFRRRH